MQFFLGLLTAVVFFVLLSGAVYIGYRIGKKKPKPQPIDEDEQRKAKQLQQDFIKLMNYNEEIALQRKKVNE
ncbi:hypothetical protein PZE06_05465 [Robertmurraya sp. DFI.2.37]|uniref:cytochrome c-type biogenesis protein CcmH n=1 Tax=Robertmurraya sp. DFI.2.37 TaxID=3031819 RepID=UPI001246D81D|nr:cytochrome c-type biogenesis protein CcmH [Robertmurraya sp. DFI.2.37]MDF1507629.1 hypothetical protein [Robertmurraya sp. DFI.2.37]